MSSKKATDEELHERRLEHSRWLLALFQDPASVASQTVAAYDELLDDILLDVAIDARRDAHFGREEPVSGGEPDGKRPKLDPYSLGLKQNGRGAPDIFGAQHPATCMELVTCQNCGRQLQAGKFAQHLERCLGKGRQAGRNARPRG
jgi:hypothetical protein